jgi:dual specificity tyrosine-phosphorylation-regulated kinase 2/3/4
MLQSLVLCKLHAGCILAELYTGHPLFPGEDEQDQLACIIEMFGLPKKKTLSLCKRERYFLSNKGQPRYCNEVRDNKGNIKVTGAYTRHGQYRGPPMSRDFVTSINNCPDMQMIDYVRRCLEVNPDERMTPTEAMHHEWFRRRTRSWRIEPLTKAPRTVSKSIQQL